MRQKLKKKLTPGFPRNIKLKKNFRGKMNYKDGQVNSIHTLEEAVSQAGQKARPTTDDKSEQGTYMYIS